MSNRNAEPRVNPVTGEIIDDSAAVAPFDHLFPEQRSMSEVDPMSFGSVDELIAAYQEPEPDPRQVALWLLGAQEKDEDDAEESQLSIMLRILGAATKEQALASQEVKGADTLIGEPLEISDVKWKKSTKGEARGVYALITAKWETTGDDVIVSCGGKNVCAQLLRLKAGGHLPVRAAIVKSSKETANGFRPLWLEPR
jgi:hypothetical protein